MDSKQASQLPGARPRRKSKRLSIPKERLQLILPEPLPPEVEELSSTAREKWIIRHTPVINSKYLPVWKRLKARLKGKLLMKNLNRELQLFGASTIAVDNEELQLKVQKLVRSGSMRSPNWQEEKLLNIAPLFVIPPNHWFKAVWNVALSLLLIYTATIMPFRLAFVEEADSGGWLVWEYAVNLLFFVDFIVNCISGYYDNDGKIVLSRGKILLAYLKGWLIIDLVACIPFSLIDTSGSGSAGGGSGSSVGYNSLIRLLRVPRLYRLFRISRLFKALKQTSDVGCMAKVQDFVSLKHSAMRLISFAMTVLICVHLMACLWYFTATMEGLSPDCWVYYFGFQDKDALTLYIASFYWAVTTLVTVGYGDISANTSLERVIAVLWMMFGVCFFSFTIGSLTSMITNIDTKETVLTNKLAIIDEFSRESKLDKPLRARLRHAIKYLTEKTGFSWSDKQNIFNELPKNLKYEVAMAMHQGAVRTLPFFEDKNEVFIAAIVPFLLPMLATAGSFVYKEGEYADEVYFLSKGRCALVILVDGEYAPVKKIQRGAYFGEIEIIQSVPRKYTVQAALDCDLLVMGKSLLGLVKEEFNGAYREMVEIAETRDILNHKAIAELRELMKMKKTQNLQGLAQAQIKEMIKKKTENYDRKLSSRLSGTTLDELKTDHSTSPLLPSQPQSPKSDTDLHSRSNVTLHRLAESERKLKLIRDLLEQQNAELRSSAGVKNRAVLPKLAIPVPKRGGESPASSGKDTPSFKEMASRVK
jgi:CRP-like cAMP-binding protein